MSQEHIFPTLQEALKRQSSELNNLVVTDKLLSTFKLERPRNAEHGDYAVNVSSLARETRLPPAKIAGIIEPQLRNNPFFTVTAVGGYLNFTMSTHAIAECLHTIVRADSPGQSSSMEAARVHLEYVSANPTGPLHIGHGRWAALGDSLVRIFRHCGAFVTSEFYINDAGVQMNNIALSLFWRCIQQLKSKQHLPETVNTPEEFPYPGEYVVSLAKHYLEQPERFQQFQSLLANESDHDFTPSVELLNQLKEFSKTTLLAEQKALLKKLGVIFDVWTSEMSLYNTTPAGNNIIESTLNTLTDAGMTYENDGALWFKSTLFEDEKDRVLKKSDGNFTYLTPDIAYHNDKYNRPEQYNCIMNIWGADHHGYVARMRGAIQALGHRAEQFEVLLGQLVNLLIDGERTRMGKRRKMLTLEDVVETVGIDATRFWMVSKSADSTLDFDIVLAASAKSENPVFYVQYAHARCCSILALVTKPAGNIDTLEAQAPLMTEQDLKDSLCNLSTADLKPLLESSLPAAEQESTRSLILLLGRFTKTVEDAARVRSPHFIVQYLQDLAGQFHSFYAVCRIISDNKDLLTARLALVKAVQKTLAQGLLLIGVSAPQKM